MLLKPQYSFRNVLKKSWSFCKKNLFVEEELRENTKLLDSSIGLSSSKEVFYFYLFKDWINISFSSGSPHAHIVLYLEDEEGIAPPTLFDIRTGEDSEQFNAKLFEEIEETNDDLYSASLADAKCPEHEDDSNSSGNGTKECEECSNIKELVKTYQTHSCTFSCHKKTQVHETS